MAATLTTAQATPPPTQPGGVTPPATNAGPSPVLSSGQKDTTVSPPSVLTSSDAAAQTQSNQATLSAWQQAHGGAGSFQFMDGSGFDASGNLVKASTPTPTPTAPAAAGTTTTGNNNTTTTPSATQTAQPSDPVAQYKAAVDANNTTNDAAVQTALTQIQNYGQTLTANTQAMIASITQQFENRKQAMQQLNAATLAGVTVAGVRSGRQQYANEINTGIVSAEESAGIQRLAELDAQEKQLILQAQSANDDKQFKLLNDSMNLIMQNNKDKQQAVLDLYKFGQQEEQIALQKLNEANAQTNADRNYLLNKAQFDQTVKQDQQKFNQDNNITGAFYTKPGSSTVYDASTGEPLTYDQYKARGGTGTPGSAFTDVQVATPTKKYDSGIIGEYQFYSDQVKAAGGKPVDFNTYQNIDANRKARASGSGYTQNQKQVLMNDQITTANNLSSVVGKDGYVSPEDYKRAYRDWVQAGHDGNDFHNLYGGFVNPVDPQDYGNEFLAKPK